MPSLRTDEPLHHLELTLPVAIRRCRAGDLAALEWGGEFTHHRALIAEAFARQARGETVLLVADAGGFPVGQAWVDLARLAAERVGYVWAVRVRSELRGRGLGAHLLAAAEEVVRRAGHLAAELRVETWNLAARRLYERQGWAVQGRVADAYRYTPPGGVEIEIALDEWILRKPLAREAAEAGRATS